QHSVRELPVSAAVLDRIDPFKSFDFYKDRFSNASGFTFVFVGNFNTDSIKPAVAKWLGGLPSTGRKETWRDTGIRPPTGVVQRVVKKGAEPKARTALIFTLSICASAAAVSASKRSGAEPKPMVKRYDGNGSLLALGLTLTP